jgi:CheY-like chemotaxis protein
MKDPSAILIADDDENDVSLLKLAFEEAKISNPIRVVRDGQEAIDYLSRKGIYADSDKHPWPAVMLLDLKMPRLDGFDVLTWWHQHNQGQYLPIIVMSSSNQESDIEAAMALGAAAYRVKPADFDYLVAVARELREHWLKPEELFC